MNSLDNIERLGLSGERAENFMDRIQGYTHVDAPPRYGVIYIKCIAYPTDGMTHVFNINDTSVLIERLNRPISKEKSLTEVNIEIASFDEDKINRAKQTLTEMTGVEFY